MSRDIVVPIEGPWGGANKRVDALGGVVAISAILGILLAVVGAFNTKQAWALVVSTLIVLGGAVALILGGTCLVGSLVVKAVKHGTAGIVR